MNPLQQGLKHCTTPRSCTLLEVAIMNPLQQGLKLSKFRDLFFTSTSCNNESTTTRIET